MVSSCIEAGATTINLPDTVGYATPDEWRDLIAWMYLQVPALRGVVLSVHCHNDLGLATANSLVSVLGGARQIETCVNGIGERAGNAALEEVAMATRLHPEVYGVTTQLDHSQLYRTSRLVSQLTGMLVQPNKAVVGANAFAHHSGIHQDGMLKDRRTFEIMEPGQVGAGSSLVLGKLSGRHALRDRLEQLGYRLDGEELQRAFVRFKELADRKRDVTDRDLEAIVADERQGAEETFRLEHLQVSCGTNLRPTATVRMLLSDGVSREAVSIGDGPVDATYRAIDMLVQVKAELEEFAIQAITEGMDAVGEVTVRLRQDGALSAGHGADTDILVAAAKAYVHALNRLTHAESRGRAADHRPNAWLDGRVSGGHTGTGNLRRRRSRMTPRTLFDKIWEAHVVAEQPGEPSLLYVDLHLVHEVTSPQAFEGLRLEGRTVRRPGLVVATMDHNVPTDGDGVSGADAMSTAQMEALTKNCEDTGIACFGAGHRWQGIVHV